MSWLHDLSLMLFPKTCQVCGEALVDGEDVICVSCDLRMPRCNFHLHPDAELPMRFAASKIARVASMFPYIRHNEFARLIQRSKYNNRPDINRHLGRKFALELLPSGFFNGPLGSCSDALLETGSSRFQSGCRDRPGSQWCHRHPCR